MKMSIRGWCQIVRAGISTILLGGVLSLLLFTGCRIQGVSAEEAKIEIGVILPLTGGWNEWGVSLRKSIDFAAKQLGIDNRFSFHYEDEGECDARKAVDSYKFLRTRHGSKLFIILCMNGTRAIKPIAKSDGALLLSVGFQEDDIFEDDGPVINYALQMNDEAELLARQAIKLGVRRLALLRDSGTEAFVEGIRKNLSLNGATTVDLDIVIQSPNFEPRSIITALKRRSIDGLFINTSPQNIYQVLRALKEQKLSLSIMSSYGFRDIMERNQFLQGFPFTVSYSFPKLSMAAASFERTFAEQLHELPRVNGLFVADMLEQLKLSTAQCPRAEDTRCMRKALASGRDVEGLSGRFTVHSDGSIHREFEIIGTVMSSVTSRSPIQHEEPFL